MTDDRHPEELLAGYVDGTLTDRERAAVESHLSACLRCREESALAMRASSALREIREEPVPVGVMNPVRAEIAQRARGSSGRPLSQRVLGWATAAAVAAAFAGVVALWVLPNAGVGGSADNAAGRAAPEAANASGTTAPAGAGAGALATAPPVALRRESTNFDDQALAKLATATATAVKSGALREAADARPQSAETDSAAACLARGAASVEPQAILVRLISARYKGDPAVIGVYLTGPGAGQPPNSVLVWVVRAGTCQTASITSSRI
jgi:hypothetical protein